MWWGVSDSVVLVHMLSVIMICVGPFSPIGLKDFSSRDVSLVINHLNS